MILTERQHYVIRQLNILSYSAFERDGKAFFIEDGQEKDFIIPYPEKVLEIMIENIRMATNSKVEKCSISNANCIIRVYWVLHQKYDWGSYFNIYGANCYTQTSCVWKTSDGIHNIPINYNQHEIRLNLCPDERLTVRAEFIDYYVKID